jgi:exopolyphosphatase/guanosine-5'-triphosphate,3'-diphosphate pyrophosphatase
VTPTPDPPTVELTVGHHRCRLDVDGHAVALPFGAASLARRLDGDPPRPEALTNAIGLVVDHLDDVVREHPTVAAATVRAAGPTLSAIAAVELGSADLPSTLLLGRGAAEDVFRTLATEAAADRRHNPGLATGLVHDVLGGCCILVAVMRSLHLDAVEIVTDGAAATIPDGDEAPDPTEPAA